MAEVEIGKVTHYFDHIHVAVLRLREPLHVGETIRLSGRATELVQKVESLQINHQAVPEILPGQEGALKVDAEVREHDRVFRVMASE